MSPEQEYAAVILISEGVKKVSQGLAQLLAELDQRRHQQPQQLLSPAVPLRPSKVESVEKADE